MSACILCFIGRELGLLAKASTSASAKVLLSLCVFVGVVAVVVLLVLCLVQEKNLFGSVFGRMLGFFLSGRLNVLDVQASKTGAGEVAPSVVAPFLFVYLTGTLSRAGI